MARLFLILNSRHLERALRVFVDYYQRAQAHRSLQLLSPAELGYVHPVALSGDLKRRDRLGGLIHEYRYAA